MFPTRKLSEPAAVRQAQQQINLLLPEGSISVDGVMGPETQGAYQSLSDTSKGLVDQLVSQRNFSILELLRDEPKTPASRTAKRWYSYKDLKGWIEEASNAYSIPTKVLDFYLNHEPNVRYSGGTKQFDAESVAPSGLYKGLMQVGNGAWQDAVRYDKREGINLLEGTSFDDAFDPMLNIFAAAAYAAINRDDYAGSKGSFRPPFTPEQYYAAHNQGPSFWTAARMGRRPQWYSNQSDKARQTIDKALSQFG